MRRYRTRKENEVKKVNINGKVFYELAEYSNTLWELIDEVETHGHTAIAYREYKNPKRGNYYIICFYNISGVERNSVGIETEFKCKSLLDIMSRCDLSKDI